MSERPRNIAARPTAILLGMTVVSCAPSKGELQGRQLILDQIVGKDVVEVQQDGRAVRIITSDGTVLRIEDCNAFEDSNALPLVSLDDRVETAEQSK